jgi:hypothetical protein
MSEINWQLTKFRASSWGNLLSEPVSKADKEAGKLSLTCQKELIKIYNQVLYGRRKEIVTACMTKGILCEDDSIALYSKVEGNIYFKNDKQLENEWFTGHPDIYLGDDILNADEVDDIKSSFELDTFIPKLIEIPDKGYEAQLNVYFDLCNCSKGNIVYTLVDAPFSVLESEKRKLLYSMDVISEESPEYLKMVLELERNLTFQDIDYRERIIKIPVHRNEELIQKMKDKVPVLRNWLQDFHTKHMNLYPKS